MLVLTWNLNVGEAGHPDVAAVLRELDADLILLQEVSSAWIPTLSPLDDTWPHMAFAGEDAGGLALLSKTPLTQVQTSDSAVDWFPAQSATVQAPWGPLEVMNVHLVPPFTRIGGGMLSLGVGWWTRHDDRKREAVEHLEVLGVPSLMAGDFNTNERGRALRWLAREHGLESALPQHQPRAKTWAWPRLPAWRLDHILLDDCLVAESAQVHRVGPSDHWPVTTQIATATDADACAAATAPSDEAQHGGADGT